MSDSYLVLNEDMQVVDFNETLLHTFSLSRSDIRKTDIIGLFKKHPEFEINVDSLISAINKTKLDDLTVVLEKHWNSINKYFHIEKPLT
jgi:hypothetical protein